MWTVKVEVAMWTAILFLIIGATFVAIAWWVEGPRLKRLARSRRAMQAGLGRDHGKGGPAE